MVHEYQLRVTQRQEVEEALLKEYLSREINIPATDITHQ